MVTYLLTYARVMRNTAEAESHTQYPCVTSVYKVNGPGIIVALVEEVFQLRDEVLAIPYDLL